MKIYKSKTTSYRIKKETRGDGRVWYNPQRRIIGYWLDNDTSYSTKEDALDAIENEIKSDNDVYLREKVVKTEYL